MLLLLLFLLGSPLLNGPSDISCHDGGDGPATFHWIASSIASLTVPKINLYKSPTKTLAFIGASVASSRQWDTCTYNKCAALTKKNPYLYKLSQKFPVQHCVDTPEHPQADGLYRQC